MSVTVRVLQGEVRARIAADGTVTSATGEIIGFINGDGSAGDTHESLLGEIDTQGKVTNSAGRVIGFINEEKMALYDIHQQIFMSISADGRIENSQIVVGTAKPYRPYLFRIISSYLWFFDPALASLGHFSLVTGEKGKGFLVEVSSERALSACLVVVDNNGKERAQLTMMGEVKSNGHELLGYINNDGTCGDQHENFLGEIKKNGDVCDKSDAIVGIWSKDRPFLQLGKELFPNISPTGEIKNKSGETVGNFQLFTPQKYVLAAAYLYFFDTTLIQTQTPSIVSSTLKNDTNVVNRLRQSGKNIPILAAPSPKEKLVNSMKGRDISQERENEKVQNLQAAIGRQQAEEKKQLLERVETERKKLESERNQQGILKLRQEQDAKDQQSLGENRLLDLDAAMRETMEAAARVEQQKLLDLQQLKKEEDELRQQQELKNKQKAELEKAQALTNQSGEEILSKIRKQLEDEKGGQPSEVQHQHSSSSMNLESQVDKSQKDAKQAATGWKRQDPNRQNGPDGINMDEVLEVAVAMYDYVHTDPSARDFFSFRAGDRFYIIQNGPELQGWKIARNVKGDKGFVPGNYLHVVQDTVLPKPTENRGVMTAITEYKTSSSEPKLSSKPTKTSSTGSTGLNGSGGMPKDPRMVASTGSTSAPSSSSGKPKKVKDKESKDKTKKVKDKEPKEKNKTPKKTKK